MRKIKIFLINTTILTLTSLLISGINTIFNIYIANKLGSETIGVFQLVLSIYFFAITISTSGINLTATKIIAEEIANGTMSGVKKAIKQCLIFSAILSITSSTLLIILAPYISENYLNNKISAKVFYILAPCLPFLSISTVISGYFSARRKASKNAMGQIIEQLSKILIIAYIFKSFMPKGIEYGCISLVIGSGLSEIFSFIYLYISFKIDKKQYRTNSNYLKTYSKKILKISVPLALTSYLRSGLSTLKQVLIPLGLQKSGISYELALSRYGMITGMVMPILMFSSIFISSIGGLLIPEFSSYYAKNAYLQLNYICNRILKLVSIFSIFIITVLMFFSDDLSLIIYNDLEISIFIRFMAPIIWFSYLDIIIDNMLKGINKQIGVMICNIIDLFVTISLIYFCLPIYGVYAYIAIIFISELLNFCISFWQLVKNIKLKSDFVLWIFKPLLSAILSIIIISIIPFSKNVTIPLLATKIIIFLFFYILSLILFKCITKRDIII